jgi:AraC-like DNA-binding protein
MDDPWSPGFCFGGYGFFLPLSRLQLAMLLKDFPPDIGLRDLVRCFRIVDFKFDKGTAIPAKAYPPKPENILHFFIKGRFGISRSPNNIDYQPPILLIGQRTAVTTQFTDAEFLNFQIVFQPSAIFQLTGLPGVEFTDRFINGEDIFGRDIRDIYDQLCAAQTSSEMMRIASHYVQRLTRSSKMESHLIDKLTSLITEKSEKMSLGWLAKESCLCGKQFERKFRERTGVNPKAYLRISRFNKAYNTKNRYPGLDWLSIADKCGYHDYQHLVKDYKNFTSLTPTAFHILEASSPEYTLGLTEEVYRSRFKRSALDF